MSKLTNVLTMIELLSSGKKYRIQELSQILEVTPRMIRHYKEEIENAGILIDSMMGPYGGYVLNKKVRIPQRKFKKEDVDFLNTLMDKVDPLEKEKLILLQDKIRGIYFGSLQEKKELSLAENQMYNLLCRAMKERKKVKICYYSYQKGISTRKIEPLDMFLYENGWCCAAYCELRKDLRHFELRRIQSCELLDETF